MKFRHHLPNRREALIGASSLFAWSQMPRLARAEGRDPRLLVIVLRGALDGLGAVAPVGDPDWISLRGDRALVLDGKISMARMFSRAGSRGRVPSIPAGSIARWSNWLPTARWICAAAGR